MKTEHHPLVADITRHDDPGERARNVHSQQVLRRLTEEETLELLPPDCRAIYLDTQQRLRREAFYSRCIVIGVTLVLSAAAIIVGRCHR